MSAEQNVKLIRSWVDAINRNDVDGELACWQPDGEYFVIATDSHFKGINELKRAGESPLQWLVINLLKVENK